jgi:hypothetical protein
VFDSNLDEAWPADFDALLTRAAEFSR